MKPRLTYANVVATLALFVALGGGAYALSKESVKSKHIRDNTIISADVKDNRGKKGGLKSKDIRFDALGADAIRESNLDVSQFLELGALGALGALGGGGGPCALATTPTNCAEARVDAPKHSSSVLVLAAGGYESTGAVPAGAFCTAELDGVGTGASASPGEAASDNTSAIATESFTMIGEETGVGQGTHVVRMMCSKSGGDVVIHDAQVMGLAIGTSP